MKKINLLMAAGLMASASVQAQTTIASVGFEASDSKYTTETAYTPGGTYGNWVNRQEGDVWNEQYADETHSGEFAFQMQNDPEHAGARWERGFVIGNLPLKDNTPYRVTFWVKGPQGASVKSSINIGHEYCDKAIGTASGKEYLYDYVGGLNGEWQKFSYVTYFTNKADQDAYAENYADKEDPNGNKPMPAGSPFPEEYNVIINCYNGGEYILDDIKIEEGVTFNQATFVADIVKLDFGYPTNIADLAKANDGVLSLDPSCVSVTADGEPVDVLYVEGNADGFLYAFLSEELDDDAKVVVSFTPAADCPILYTDDQRPSADVESDLKVFGFSGEVAELDYNIDALPSAWSPASMVSSVPENESFELDADALKNIAVTFNKEVSIDYAGAMLQYSNNFGPQEIDLNEGLSLSDDRKTINVTVPKLDDGEYTLVLTGVTNSYGIDCEGEQTVTFAVGKDTDTSTSETVYASDFDNDMTDGIPPGWVTYNEAGFHIYGFNDEERTQQYNYGWGGKPGGGGARLYAGFSGDFNKAMYWGSRGTNDGYAEYGSQVKDWILEGGEIDPEMPDDIALKLEARKYQVSFVMAAWKGEPVFRFTLEDLEGNVYARFNDFVATPNMNGNTGKVTGSLKCTTDFTVPQAGYYVLRFAAQDAQWQEFLLANVKVITMPSKAAYWKQQLAAAVEPAKAVLETAAEECYDGATKTALKEVIAEAQAGGFTSPSEVEAEIEKLKEASAKMQARIQNHDNFQVSLLAAIAAYGDIEATKYENVDVAKTAKALIDQYENVDPSTLSDEVLADVAPALVSTASKLGNVKTCTDLLTWGIYKARQTYEIIGTDDAAAYDAAANVVSDDREVADAINNANKLRVLQILAEGDIPDAYLTKLNAQGQVADESEDVDFAGIELTGCVQNPKFYRVLGDDGVPGWTITPGSDETNLNIGFNTSATEENYVVDAQINIYGNADYDFSQILSDVPAGIYNVQIYTRTPLVDKTADFQKIFYYNAQNDDTKVWDKFIYAQGQDDQVVEPYTGASGLTSTVIKSIAVDDNGMVIGAHEHYVSGKAEKHEDNTPQDFWTGTTYVDDVHIYLVAPLPGYNYANAAEDMATSIENIETAATSKKADATYNLAGQRVDASYKGIIIKNGKKVLVK